MLATAARRWPLAVAALAAVAGIIAAVVVVTTDSSQPAPEFTLNSTTRAIPDGVLTGGGSCTTITRSTNGESGVTVHANLLSLCPAPLRIDLPGGFSAQQIWIGESEAAPERPQSRSPGSFRNLPPAVIRHLPEPAQSSVLYFQ